MNEKKIKVYELKEVCKELNIGLQVLRSYIKEGKIKASKIGRKYVITEESINDFINSNLVEPKRDLEELTKELLGINEKNAKLLEDIEAELKDTPKEKLEELKKKLDNEPITVNSRNSIQLLTLVNEELAKR